MRTRAIVQFPHPGGEHVPSGDHMAWNMGAHRRKFLLNNGVVVDEAGTIRRRGPLAFWGEWEAPSHIVDRWTPTPGLPTVLHQPVRSVPPPGSRQNTDPWVFGDAFLYSNCKQLNPSRRPSALQRIDVGSLVLFGSSHSGEFVIDTVFVVGAIIGNFVPLAGDEFDLPAGFRLCTIDSLTTGDETYAAAEFTLFRGATPDCPVDEMFSFVPARAADGHDTRFARPPIRLPGMINPASRQAPSGAKQERTMEETQAAWHAVVSQVEAAGLELACQLAMPDEMSAAAFESPYVTD